MRRLSVSLLLLLLASCAASREASREAGGEGPRVESLSIEGTHDVSERELKEKIATTESPWYRRLFPWLPMWLGEDPRFDPNAFQADLRRIERYYQARGYYQADVVGEQVLGPDGKPVEEDAPLPREVRLQVEVREGEPTRLAEVRIEGLDTLPERERAGVLAELPLREGDVFREEAWETTKALIASRLRELGHAEAEVEGEVQVDVEHQRARAVLAVQPGRRYVFGKIFVATDARPVVSPQRIIEQARGALREGAPYSESALAEAQARVSRMGVFGAVKVNRGLVNREAGTVPVVIDVREAAFHNVRLGGGVGNDAVRSEVRLLGEYTDRNFFGGLRRLTVGGRGGYAVVPSLLTPAPAHPGGFIFDVQAELEQPRILFRDLSLQTKVFAERNLLQGLFYQGGGGRLGFVWQPTPWFSLVPSYNFENYFQRGVVTAGTAPTNLNLGCPTPGEESCRVIFSFLEQQLEWDRRDERISPRDGYYLALSLQEGGFVLGGSFNYARLLPEGRYYRSFGHGNRLTLAARVRAGTLLAFPSAGDRRLAAEEGRGPIATTPILARFFAGGANSMRGFNSRRLAPQQLQPESPDSPRFIALPIGGKGLFEGSLELRYQVLGPLVLATFLDTGAVTAQSFGRLQREVGTGAGEGTVNLPVYLAQNLAYAVGGGVRYLTPVGPIRIDLAYRLGEQQPVLLAPNGAEVPRGQARTGPVPNYDEPRFVFHLSIGEAF